MGSKWGSNEGICIGDIFACWCGPYVARPETDYYQVAALRGRTQVVLRPLRMEMFINEGIEEGSLLYWLRERNRPLPGQFLTADELMTLVCDERGKEIKRTGVEVTAWVLPDRTVDDRLLLQEIHWKSLFSLAQPEDWEPWGAETIKQMEEEYLQEKEDFARRFLGEEGHARFREENAKEAEERT